MNLERLCVLVMYGILGLIEDDRESAIEYFHDTMEMTLGELEYFGVKLTEDELNKYKWKEGKLTC